MCPFHLIFTPNICFTNGFDNTMSPFTSTDIFSFVRLRGANPTTPQRRLNYDTGYAKSDP